MDSSRQHFLLFIASVHDNHFLESSFFSFSKVSLSRNLASGFLGVLANAGDGDRGSNESSEARGTAYNPVNDKEEGNLEEHKNSSSSASFNLEASDKEQGGKGSQYSHQDQDGPLSQGRCNDTLNGEENWGEQDNHHGENVVHGSKVFGVQFAKVDHNQCHENSAGSTEAETVKAVGGHDFTLAPESA